MPDWLIMPYGGGVMVCETGKHKARVVSFWAEYGLEAPIEAFGVNPRTLYYWRSKLKKGAGN